MHTMNTVAPGAIPVLLTPFRPDGKLDYEALDELVEFYIKAGVSALFADCLSSEVFFLSAEERLELARRVVKQASGRIAILAGANFEATLQKQARELELMYDTGVDAAVVLISNLPQADELVGQLLKLAELTSVPLGLYECPVPTHRVLDDKQIGILADSSRFIFMKDTIRDLPMCVKKVQRAAGSSLRIFEANIRYTPDTLRAGGYGHCGVIANPCPELCASYCDKTIKDESYRQRVFDAMMTVHELMNANNYPASAKYILGKRGLRIGTTMRAHASELFTNVHRRAVDEALEGFDFLPPAR
ncbi:MAG: dihydrodipicolinate synthase family protein [Armatimonadota bacterium]